MEKNVEEIIKQLDMKIKERDFICGGHLLFSILNITNNNGQYDKTKHIYEKYKPILNFNDKCLNNMLLNCYELASKEYFLTSYPRQLYLMVTNVCSLKCIMCQQRLEKKVMYMPNKYKEELLELAPYLQEITWQGGEVLIYNDFKEMLFKLSKYSNVKHSIVSNFQINDDELIRLLPTLNIGLTISVDGSTKELYEKIRINGDFKKLVSNIKMFNEIRFKQKRYISLGMHFVVMKENYRDIANIVEFAYENNFNHIQYIYVVGDKSYELDNDDKKEILFLVDKAKQKAVEYNIYIDTNSITDTIVVKDRLKLKADFKKEIQKNFDNNKLFCHMPWYKLTFDTDYNFSADCQCLKKESYINKSILECWNSISMQEYRKKIIDGSFKNICSTNCFLRNR